MKNSSLGKFTAGVLIVSMGAMVLGGCMSRSGLVKYPAGVAWNKMEDAKNAGGIIGGIPDPRTQALAEQYTRAEEESKEASQQADTPVLALDEIVDDVSKYLVSELPKHAKAQGAEWRLTLAVGTLIDGTEDQVLGTALDRIARNLQRNAEFRKHFKVLSSTKSDADQIILELSGTHPDDIYLPDSDASTGTTIHPDDLYVLTGRTDVFKSKQDRVLKTVTLIDIQHPNSRENVLSADFSRTYYFHPGDMDYITEAENQRRADAQAGGK